MLCKNRFIGRRDHDSWGDQRDPSDIRFGNEPYDHILLVYLRKHENENGQALVFAAGFEYWRYAV